MGGGKSAVDIHEDASPTLCTTRYGEPAVCYRGDGATGGETSFTIVGQHESTISDMTNIVIEPEENVGGVMAFMKKTHPKLGGFQNWEPALKSDTLNTFDTGETRTPTVVVETNEKDTN